MHKIPACLIIDPYISPTTICQALSNRGIAPIAILCDTWSDPEWKKERLQEAKFAKIIECYTAEQYDNIKLALESYNILGLIYGKEENSIYPADIISRRFFPQFSNLGDSSMRANKFEMNEACRRAGLMAAQQLKIKSKQLASRQIEAVLAILPVVVKPTLASGSVGVAVCQTLAEVQSAISRLLGQKCHVGNIAEVVVQQQLKGVEYFVDTVSQNGKHFICGVFRYKKIVHGLKIIYRWAELVDHLTDEAKVAIEYVKKALDAVGIRYGLAHTELFLTADGPRLIEVNPRISGAYGFVNKMAKLTYDTNQIEFLADILLNKKALVDIVTDTPPKKYSVTLCLQNWTPRKIGPLKVSALQKFPSYVEHVVLKPAGSEMGLPTDLRDTVAFVLLANSSHAALFDDVNSILSLEEQGCLF